MGHMRRRLLLWFVSLFLLAMSLTFVLQACTSNDSPTATPSASTERIAQEHQGDQPEASEIALQKPAQEVISQEVNYATLDGQAIAGFSAEPASASAPLPGIIAIHEWWGLNDNIKAVTELLAGEGYHVLAVDLFQGQVADKPEQARKLVKAVMQNPQVAEDNIRQAYDYLARNQNAPKIGSIGWCFGGAWSLKTGLLLPKKMDALVIYYGQLETDSAVLAPLEMPIAGFFGGKDQGIPVSEVRAFESSLQALEKTNEIHIYEDAGHAFANPSGRRYNSKAAEDAWQKTTDFFARNLQS